MHDESDIRVFIRHVRTERACARGARAWFAAVGLDWTKFLSEGITVRELRSTGDVLPERMIRVAVKEAQDGR